MSDPLADAGALPHIDDHEVVVEAPPAVVYRALRSYVQTIGTSAGHPLARLLGTDPPSGFAVVEEVPDRLVRLAGQHRFSRYQLVFDLRPTATGTVLRARTYAMFPGVPGRAYRAAVIGSRGHVLATRRLLCGIRRRALAGSA